MGLGLLAVAVASALLLGRNLNSLEERSSEGSASPA
jgi:hypothetical protein